MQHERAATFLFLRDYDFASFSGKNTRGGGVHVGKEYGLHASAQQAYALAHRSSRGNALRQVGEQLTERDRGQQGLLLRAACGKADE